MTLYILQYNNYYNRILKKEETLEAYQEYVYYMLDKVNFAPNDGVNAMHTVGVGDYDGKGDYLLVCSEQGIDSRWFIIDTVRKRGGQYDLTLRRDLLADFKDNILDAPCFVEKGMVNLNSNIIFNNENMSYNQIKTNEYSLKDETETAWLVGYLARSEDAPQPVEYELSLPFDFTSATLEDFDGYQYFENTTQTSLPKTYISKSVLFASKYEGATETDIYYDHYRLDGSLIEHTQDASEFNNARTTTFETQPLGIRRSEYTALDNSIQQYFNNNTPVLFKNDDVYDIKRYKDKVLRVGIGAQYVYYQLELKTRIVNNVVEAVADNYENKGLYDTYSDWIYTYSNAQYPNRKGVYGYNTYTEYYLTYREINIEPGDRYRVDISAARNKLEDAPYDMFCMPVDPLTLGTDTYNTEKINLLMAQAIYAGLGSGAVYDIQLLPYCPFDGMEVYMQSGISPFLVEGTDFSYIKKISGDETTNVSILFYPTKSSFNKVIPLQIEVPDNNIEFKVSNECDMYRLCSPNYNGLFEFSLTKNGGLNYIEVNCTYKPFNPYIHLNPNFGRLYGRDFNDQRGLICGGDFSIATASDAWENYELQNKNYQKVFDRQIQNMEFNNNLARTQEGWQIATGTVSGGLSGAVSGSMMGGGIGAGVGAVVGAGASLAGGIADYYLNEQRRGEALDYTKDMFGYQLGNIKALPNSLAKSNAFDINSKIFPFIEYYTCSDEEKNALRNKIKYNGMTVNIIGRLADYVYNEEGYVKGKIIRLTDLEEDYHITNSISGEVNQGFFYKE